MIEELLKYLFFSVFISINIYILYSDFLYKRIPNKALLSLLILSLFGYLFFPFLTISPSFILWFLINIIASFTLFYFNIWSAGDAKYVIVLSCFIPGGTLIYTLGNIGLLTLLYLFGHTIYIYIVKSIIDLQHGKELGNNIYHDLKEQLSTFFIKSQQGGFNIGAIIKKIIPLLLGFLIFFTVLRLIRIYIINNYIENSSDSGSGGRWAYLIELIQKYDMYIILGLVITLYVIYRLLHSYTKKGFFYICKKVNLSENTGKGILLIFFGLGLVTFIAYEYSHNPQLIRESLIRIFTFYIFLWLFIKLLWYMHYVTFQLGEVVYKPISKLSSEDIVDIPFLQKIFGTQKALGYKQETGKYAPEPKKYFENIENPISKKTSFELKDIYKTVNRYHKKNDTPGFEKIEAIKVLKTFAFAPYIFIGFMISYIYGDSIIKSISEFLLQIVLGEV